MGARGSILKQQIADKILATFPGSFLYNDGKEIRINGVEESQSLQIKVTLTCAKVAVEGGSDTILPGEGEAVVTANKLPEPSEKVPQEPTAAEKERLKTLLDRLGL